MRFLRHFPRVTFGLALCAFLSGGAVASAQMGTGDPIDALRSALKGRVFDPTRNVEALAARRTAVASAIANLHGVGDLRRGAMLNEWLDQDQEATIASIDRTLRGQLLNRLEQSLRDILKKGDDTARFAAAAMIGDMGITIRGPTSNTGVSDPGGFARSLAPDLADLIKDDPSPNVRAAAAKALANINPFPKMASASFRDLLRDPNPVLREAAAAGLMTLVQHIVLINPVRGKNIMGVEATNADVVQMGTSVVPVAARGLTDPDKLVRRNCVDAIRLSAVALIDMLPSPEDRRAAYDTLGARDTLRSSPLEPATEVMPLARVLLLEAADVAKLANDPDPQVRLRACQALEDMATARQRITGQGGSDITFPPPGGESGGQARILLNHIILTQAPLAPGQSSAQVLQATLPAMARSLRDPDVHVRLAALDYLEMLGKDAAPAAPAIVGALRDPDLFVRWAATRTLGKIGPVDAKESVPALAQLMSDPDLDLRVTTATVLEHYGSAAAPAAPAIANSIASGDAEIRIAALRALLAIGPDASQYVPVIVSALRYPDVRVRRTAAEVLGHMGPAARTAQAELRRLLSDDDAEVRRGASDALLDILAAPAPKEPTKPTER